MFDSKNFLIRMALLALLVLIIAAGAWLAGKR